MSATPRKSAEISHGRGGAGNIGADSTVYVDGEVVRQGLVGDHGDGAYSTGRGGVANIGAPGLPSTKRNDDLHVPEAALRPSSEDQTYHTGRGGEGNLHKPEGEPTVKKQEGLADKLKNKLFKKKVAKEEAAATTTASTTT